jgi:hypothetical protein
MVWEWSRLRTLNSSEMTTGEAARILISIGLVESLFDLDKIDSRNPRTGNVDRGYFQISDPVRRSLARVPEFRSYSPGDYYRPWVSAQAASYHLFVKLLHVSRGDIHRAIGMYNAGPAGTREKAQGYFLAVVDRYGDTFIEQNRHSPTRYLMLRYAQPEYFSGIESDRLFTYGSGTALAMSRTAAPDEAGETSLTSPQP